MIKIEKGEDNYIVSKNSFEIYFKPLGFEIVESKKEAKIEEPVVAKETSKKAEKELKAGDKK